MTEQPYAPYPRTGPAWPGGAPLPPPPPSPPPRSNGKTVLVVVLAVALVATSVALLVVLTSHKQDGPVPTSGSPNGSHGDGRAATARPSAVSQQPARPKTAYEQVAFDYVSAVQNSDLASARRLACVSFREQVKLAPLGLHSPSGVTVDKVDSFELGGANAVTESGDVLVKATVGIRVQDGGGWVHWIFTIQPEGGEPRICGQTVLDKLDMVPDPR